MNKGCVPPFVPHAPTLQNSQVTIRFILLRTNNLLHSIFPGEQSKDVANRKQAKWKGKFRRSNNLNKNKEFSDTRPNKWEIQTRQKEIQLLE